jgi:hydrogenase-4 membrane subunit HyfE
MTNIAALASALALSLSFVMFFTRRIAALLRICTVQALAAAVAAGAQGWMRHDVSLCIAALLAFALNGLALPLALRRLVERATTPAPLRWRCGFAASTAAAFALAAASVARAMLLAGGQQFEPLALGMAILLLGLLLLAVRSHRMLPALGLLSAQNGVVLAVCAISSPPLSVLLVAVIPLVPSLAVAGLWLRDRTRLAVAPPWA